MFGCVFLFMLDILFLDELFVVLDVVCKEDIFLYLECLCDYMCLLMIYVSYVVFEVVCLVNYVVLLKDGKVV